MGGVLNDQEHWTTISCGGSYRGAGIKIQAGDQLRPKSSSSSGHRKTFALVNRPVPTLRPPRFPRDRETITTRPLSRVSALTLVESPPSDPSRRRTWDRCEPGPQDTHVGSPEAVGPEPAAPAWKRLINLPPSTEECISLITTIFSDGHETEVVKNLDGDDAQSVVDAVYQVLPAFI